MEVLLARENGFCFGVKKAVELTEAAAETGKTVHNLGQVVHNPKISERLAAEDGLTVGSPISIEGAGDRVSYRVIGILSGDGPSDDPAALGCSHRLEGIDPVAP